MVTWYHWAAFVSFLLIVLSVDLGVLHRDAHAVPLGEALAWTAVWLGMAIGFGVLLAAWLGPEAAAEYAAGYLIEWSLSVDNVFVFLLIFGHFAVPGRYQHRVLFWGVLGAIFLRLTFILAGSALLHRFEWVIFLFGGLLFVTAVRLMVGKEKGTIEASTTLRVIRRALPLADRYDGQRLTSRMGGRRLATPLLAVLVMIELTDVVFAVDSVPAVFSITRDAFVAFTSNAMAILGLRSMYFVLAGAVGRFRYLRPALATILAFVGLKMVSSEWVHVPIVVSLGVIMGILGIGVVASIGRGRLRPTN